MHVPPCPTSFRPLPLGFKFFLNPFRFLQTLSPSHVLVLPSCNTCNIVQNPVMSPLSVFLRASSCFLASFLLRFLSPSQPGLCQRSTTAGCSCFLLHSDRMWSRHEMIFPCFFSPPCLLYLRLLVCCRNMTSPDVSPFSPFVSLFAYLSWMLLHILPSYLCTSPGWSKFRVRN